MPEIYCLIQSSDGTSTLIAKKKIFNSWWGGRVDEKSLVNQAGQWAPIAGGEIKRDETPLIAAIREMREENGVAIGRYTVLFSNIVQFANYYLVILKLTDRSFDQMSIDIQNNIFDSTGNIQPPSRDVVDWENALVDIILTKNIKEYLGCHVNLGNEIEEMVDAMARPNSQKIDWFGSIANYVYSLPAPSYNAFIGNQLEDIPMQVNSAIGKQYKGLDVMLEAQRKLQYSNTATFKTDVLLSTESSILQDQNVLYESIAETASAKNLDNHFLATQSKDIEEGFFSTESGYSILYGLGLFTAIGFIGAYYVYNYCYGYNDPSAEPLIGKNIDVSYDSIT